jgi:hypothetical protein
MDDGGVSTRRPVLRPSGASDALVPERTRPAGTDPDADESSADAARARFRAEGVVAVTPDARIQHLLEPDEVLVAVRHAVVADSRAAADGAGVPPGVSGDLYLTSDRLIFAGGVFVAYPLGDVLEAVVAGEDVLLVMRDGVGLRVAVEEPRLLRVQISAARATRRGQVPADWDGRDDRAAGEPQAPSR